MNETQRKLLIAIGVIVLGMLLYPPYRIYGAGTHSSTIRETGYDWLFNLPERATVDIATLAVQWLGVLIVGGIAYFILNPSSRVAQLRTASAADSGMAVEGEKSLGSSDAGTAAPLSNRELYKAYLGEKNQDYYLNKFEDFDRLGDGMHISWNWGAFFFFVIWPLYRKMYLWSFSILIISAILKVIESHSPSVLLLLFDISLFSAFVVFSNALYHRKVKKEIAAAQGIARDDDGLIYLLRKKGGVNSWAIWVFWISLLITIIGIVAAVAIPAYQDYQKRTAATQSQSQNPAPALNPWDHDWKPEPKKTASVDAVKKELMAKPLMWDDLPEDKPKTAPQEVVTLTFERKLQDRIPDFEQINADPRWVAWLDENRPGRATRRSEAQAAYERGDIEATASYIEMFKRETSQTAATTTPAMIRIPGKNYEMGKYEVTQGEWRSVMGNSPSAFPTCGDTCPVDTVSWNDAQAFIKKLNAKTGKQYRLPTEAEWEYACYGGRKTEYCGGNDLDAVGWYDGNSNNTTHPAGQKQANGYGLYDMSGNVWEWMQNCVGSCGDITPHIVRGGSWFNDANNSRSGSTNIGTSDMRTTAYGFRLARTLP